MTVINNDDLYFNVVLVHPEIPNNTGNIGRLCVATNCKLHLIHPIGFQLDEKAVRRSGIDWWGKVDLYEYKDWDEFKTYFNGSNFYFFSRFADDKNMFHSHFKKNDYLIFGSETKGLPEDIKLEFKDHIVKIPMPGEGRSLNLANSVSVAVYEGIRQLSFT